MTASVEIGVCVCVCVCVCMSEWTQETWKRVRCHWANKS